MTKRRKAVKITEIIFYPIKPTDKGLICYVSFTYNESFRIQDCGIYTRPTGGYRILYPIKILANGKSVSSVYPINKEIGKAVEEIILTAYEVFIKKATHS